MKKPKIIYIEWYDAYSDDDWQSITEALINTADLMLCRTIGFLVSRTKDQVVISHTTAFNSSHSNRIVCGCLHIPMKAVKSIKKVKL